MIYMFTSLYDVTDFDLYWSYGQKARTVVEQYGGKFMIASWQNFKITAMEGEKPDIINLAIFRDKESYFEFYNSPEYQVLIPERTACCRSQILMLEKNEIN